MEEVEMGLAGVREGYEVLDAMEDHDAVLSRLLQRRSKRLNHRTVAAVLEEAAGVFGTESRDRSAHRFEKSFSATRLGFTHQAFDLAECLLDGVEVRCIGWQIHKLTTLALNELPNPLSLVSGEVIHHHHLTSTQVGCQDQLHICFEDLTVGRTFHGQRWPHPLHAHARKQRGVLPPIARHRALSPLSFLGPPIQSIERGVRAHLIDKHQTTSIEGASDHHLPGSSQPFVWFQRPHSPFFRLKPIRLRSLLKVDSLRLLPAKLSSKWRLSLTVAAGLVRMSSSSSLLVVTSAMGGLPPPFLGVRGSPRSASVV